MKDQYLDNEAQSALSNHMRKIAQMIYDAELRREDSLIQQSGQMQTAFSFTSAALFMVAAIIVEHRGVLTQGFLLLVFSSITAFLLLSLFFATMAQKREKREQFCSIKETKEAIEKTYESIQTNAAKDLQYINLLEKIQADLKRANDVKVLYIQKSMRAFFFSMALAVFYFVVALIFINMKGQ